ncbi:hypothetical protein HK100_005248 [Physocladia obscura]|uniref:Uncharacterized protein n=1 Tax=Physocladia obscura TaxID=109957 RepID=A0AAD5SRW9_9FUNG|nr:hypothetical protein HK100_005248 [Physocladia obscura]
MRAFQVFNFKDIESLDISVLTKSWFSVSMNSMSHRIHEIIFWAISGAGGGGGRGENNSSQNGYFDDVYIDELHHRVCLVSSVLQEGVNTNLFGLGQIQVVVMENLANFLKDKYVRMVLDLPIYEQGHWLINTRLELFLEHGISDVNVRIKIYVSYSFNRRTYTKTNANLEISQTRSLADLKDICARLLFGMFAIDSMPPTREEENTLWSQLILLSPSMNCFSRSQLILWLRDGYKLHVVKSVL